MIFLYLLNLEISFIEQGTEFGYILAAPFRGIVDRDIPFAFMEPRDSFGKVYCP